MEKRGICSGLQVQRQLIELQKKVASILLFPKLLYCSPEFSKFATYFAEVSVRESFYLKDFFIIQPKTQEPWLLSKTAEKTSRPSKRY